MFANPKPGPSMLYILAPDARLCTPRWMPAPPTLHPTPDARQCIVVDRTPTTFTPDGTLLMEPLCAPTPFYTPRSHSHLMPQQIMQEVARMGLTPDWVIHAAAFHVFQLPKPSAQVCAQACEQHDGSPGFSPLPFHPQQMRRSTFYTSFHSKIAGKCWAHGCIALWESPS